MANHKSALKRARQGEDRRQRKMSTKTRVKSVTKSILQASAEASADELASSLNTAKSVIDKAAKAGVIHKKTASRKISRLSRIANARNA